MKKRLISLLLVTACAFCMLAPSAGALDISDWHLQPLTAADEGQPASEVRLTSDTTAAVYSESGEIVPLSAVVCGTCGKLISTGSYLYSRNVIVATSNTCYTRYDYYEFKCPNDGYSTLIADGTPIGAHSWGGLNSDGYTHTCTVCGYTDRA